MEIQLEAVLEEGKKESNTLRSLMMSPASMPDILIGKSSLVFSISAIILALTIYLVGYEPANILLLAAALIIRLYFI